MTSVRLMFMDTIHSPFPSHSQRWPAYSHIHVTKAKLRDMLCATMESQANPNSSPREAQSSVEAPEIAVFVYGTLRKGASNHWRMSSAKWFANATVLGKLFRIDWYPGLILDPQAKSIHGEIYFCDPTLLQELDAFEGTIEYRRVTTIATAENGETFPVQLWEYQLPTDPCNELISGDWLK